MPSAKKSARPAASAADSQGETPDVTFHKRMTIGKQALASSSALAHLLPGSSQRSKRGREGAPDDGSQQESKRPRGAKDAPDPAADREKLRQERRDRKKAKKQLRRNEQDASASADPGPGVVYVGHIPHGFYEKQMHGFFGQFGNVSRVRMSRSRKTARSRGFAFVEFSNADVARIAAGAMDGYLMLGRSLVAKYVDPEDLHPKTFEGAGRTFRRIPWATVERKRNLTAARVPEKLARRSAATAKAHAKKQEKLKALGISYKFPTLQNGKAPSASEDGGNENKEKNSEVDAMEVDEAGSKKQKTGSKKRAEAGSKKRADAPNKEQDELMQKAAVVAEEPSTPAKRRGRNPSELSAKKSVEKRVTRSARKPAQRSARKSSSKGKASS